MYQVMQMEISVITHVSSVKTAGELNCANHGA